MAASLHGRQIRVGTPGRRPVPLLGSGNVRRVRLEYETFSELLTALSLAEDRELQLGDSSELLRDSEWILVRVRAGVAQTAVAAQAVERESVFSLRFEPRDWRQLERFAGSGLRSPGMQSGPPPVPTRDCCPVLVVAEPELQPVLRAMVTRCGFAVLTAGSAEEAFDRLRDHRVDLLVVEQNLPGMSACEFCDRLRRERRMHRPILMLAAHQFAASGKEPSCIAADDYVLEPVRAAELSARMLGLLARATSTPLPGLVQQQRLG